MTDTNTEGNGSAPVTDGSRKFVLQALHLKDLSFEAPNNPGQFSQKGVEPDVQLSLSSGNRKLAEDTFEVTLHLSIHTTAAEQTMFLVELDQVGIFRVEGYSDDETRIILGTHCPTTLYPYARELVSSLVSKGGFPPLVLQHIDFDALYAQSSQQSGDVTTQN